VNLAAKLLSRSSLRILPFLALAPVLGGCHDEAVVARDTVTIDGSFLDSDGAVRPVLIEDQPDVLYLSEGEMDATFFIPTSDGGDILFTLTGVLPEGEHVDEEIPLRLCACRQPDIHELEELGAWCADDQERLCTDVSARMTGIFDDTDCNAVTCLDQVHVALVIPEGAEFTGTLTFVHEESWSMRNYML